MPYYDIGNITELNKQLNKKYHDVFVKLEDDLSADLKKAFDCNSIDQQLLATMMGQCLLHTGICASEIIMNSLRAAIP